MVDCTENIFQFIKKWKWFIQGFWLLSAIGCCFFALDLPNETVFQFLPPKGSESEIAYNEMGKYFPDFVFIDVEVILIEAKWDIPNKENNTIISNNKTKQLVTLINNTIWKINKNYNLLLTIETYYDTSNITNEIYKNISIQELINDASAAKYIDSNQDCMLLFVESNINGATTKTLDGFIDEIKDNLNNINLNYTEYNCVLTGGITIFQECMQVIANDITSRDIIMMPLIFCIMIYMIGSWKLVALPGASLGMTIVISFGIFYPFALYYLQVNPMAPSIMMFLSMALSIDYSMFLLSRFAKERNEGKSVENSVKEMLRYSAHVVMLSGTILIICYMSIVIFPVAGMETVGYGAGISILCCMLINISMTASAILSFPKYYGTLETFPSCLIRFCAKTCICFSFCDKYRSYGIINNNNNKSDHDETLLAVNDKQDEEEEEEYYINGSAEPSQAKSSVLGASAANGDTHSDLLVNNGKKSMPIITENMSLVLY